ncbi:MAG: tetratricopeptide repeat protein [Burkholderiales bacterium]|nr:tetratricopeptide repeat protein [Burkholderiales bacterium]
MEHEIREAPLNLYNPTAKDAETLLAEFIDRKKLLARILDIVQHNVPDRPQQHVIVVGPRGMGKTTLLCAIRYSVQKDDALSQEWLPLQFNEEQYGIGDLADFWLEALRHLEIELKSVPSKSDQLLNEASDKLAQQAQNAFFELLAQSGRRALLLVDNINGLFAAIDDGIALNKLRALWMTDPRMMVIGATPSHFDEVSAVDQAFHDFFRIFYLDRLTQEELEVFLRHLAEMRGDAQVIHAIEHEPQRIAAMRILTGGNPRLVMLGYRVLKEGFDGDVRRDLERLLDECTPFFKHRIESLAKEARRTFDAIARRWDPVTVDDIRVELRKPSNYISAQIKRLIAEGFIEAISGEKKKRYQVSERFYNVYYLMRYSREGRRRLRWLVNFMQVFYTRQDYKHWARRLGDELAQPLAESQRLEKLSLLQTMSMAADNDGRYAAFEAMVNDAITRNDRSLLDEEFADGDPVERYGFRYFAAEILWDLQQEDRTLLGYKPGTENWWKKLRQMLGQKNLTLKIATHLKLFKNWHTHTARHAVAVGIILHWLFDQLRESEAVFREVIKIDPQDVHAWTNLGIVLSDQGQHKEAEQAYRKAIELDPQHVLAWNNLGIALSDQSQHKEAEEAYRKAIELDPQHVLAWNNLGSVLRNQNQHKEAEQAYRKAIELDPQHVLAWNNLGIALSDQNQHKEAEEAFRKAIELDPQYVHAWNGLGIVLSDQGQHKEAEEAYRKAIELDSQFLFVMTNLAGTCLFDLNKTEEGVALLAQGLSLDPEDRYGRYVLGRFWREALPVGAKQIAANGNATASDNLRKAITETLLAKAASGQHKAVLEALLALDETAQQPFETLILALQALNDRSVLQHIAREKRDVVLDVMASIAPEDGFDAKKDGTN